MQHTRAKLLGHPAHPILVGLPLTFYAATLIAYVVSMATADRWWFHLGVVFNVAGVIGAVAAAIPGIIDWALAIPRGRPAKMLGMEHMLLNLAALVVFAVDAGTQLDRWTLGARSPLAVVLAAGGLGLTLGAGFLGWAVSHQASLGLQDDHASTPTVRRGARVRWPI